MEERPFTTEEIDRLLQNLPSFFPFAAKREVHASYLRSLRQNMEDWLRQERIPRDFNQWDAFRTMIEKKISKTVVQAGESVGVICAQSIGERQTQLSVDRDTPLWFRQKGQWKFASIGGFVDRLLETRVGVSVSPSSCPCFFPAITATAVSIHEDHHSHQIYPCWDSDEFEIPMIEASGEVRMRAIVEWSKHWDIGPMVEVEVDAGRSIRATCAHSFVRRNPSSGQIEPVQGRDLRIGDLIPRYEFDFDSIEKEEWKRESVRWEPILALSFTETDEGRWVYDLSVHGNQTFMLANGLFVHNTLNSFHQSGLAVATVVTGVPRFLELLNATKDPKLATNSFELKASVSLSFLDEYKKRIGNQLVETYLHHLRKSETCHIGDKSEEYWYTPFEMIYGNRFRERSCCISILLDPSILYERHISLLDIKEMIEFVYGDLVCVVSPLHVAQIDVFVDTSAIQTSAIYQSRYQTIHMYLHRIVIQRLLDIKISGVEQIRHYHLRRVDTVSAESSQWMVDTEGSNLKKILALPFVRASTVRSNNMWEIYDIMGIEATREFLIEEFTQVVSSDGTFINPSHILLLVDIMTYQGNINSISRYGIKREEMGVLSRSSFEESLDHFCKAGIFTEVDDIRAVSAKIMCGRRSSIGSGLCSLKMDWSKLQYSHAQSSSPTVVEHPRPIDPRPLTSINSSFERPYIEDVSF